jgi:hypothetical protein
MPFDLDTEDVPSKDALAEVEEELGTKGAFSRNACAEAIPDGVSAINLIDGQEIVSLLKRYELGVRMVMVQKALVVNGERIRGI